MDGPRGHYVKLSKSNKDKYCVVSLYVEAKKAEVVETEVRMVVTRDCGGLGNRGDVDQRVQTSSSKMGKFWGSNVQHCDYS